MEHTTLKFKTTLQCGGCVSKVQADLDQAVGAGAWQVDLDHPDRILTLPSTGLTEAEVMSIVQSKGFSIEPIA